MLSTNKVYCMAVLTWVRMHSQADRGDFLATPPGKQDKDINGWSVSTKWSLPLDRKAWWEKCTELGMSKYHLRDW